MNGQPSSHQVPKMHKLRLRARGLPPFRLGVLTGFMVVAVASPWSRTGHRIGFLNAHEVVQQRERGASSLDVRPFSGSHLVRVSRPLFIQACA